MLARTVCRDGQLPSVVMNEAAKSVRPQRCAFQRNHPAGAIGYQRRTPQLSALLQECPLLRTGNFKHDSVGSAVRNLEAEVITGNRRNLSRREIFVLRIGLNLHVVQINAIG